MEPHGAEEPERTQSSTSGRTSEASVHSGESELPPPPAPTEQRLAEVHIGGTCLTLRVVLFSPSQG